MSVVLALVGTQSTDTFHSWNLDEERRGLRALALAFCCFLTNRNDSAKAFSDSLRSWNSFRRFNRSSSFTHGRRSVSNSYKLDSVRLMRFAGGMAETIQNKHNTNTYTGEDMLLQRVRRKETKWMHAYRDTYMHTQMIECQQTYHAVWPILAAARCTKPHEESTSD